VVSKLTNSQDIGCRIWASESQHKGINPLQLRVQW